LTRIGNWQKKIRTARYLQYEQSKKLGIPVKSWEAVDKTHKQSMKTYREQTADKLKAYRHRHFSISKDHAIVMKRRMEKSKDVQVDRGR